MQRLNSSPSPFFVIIVVNIVVVVITTVVITIVVIAVVSILKNYYEKEAYGHVLFLFFLPALYKS